MTTTDLAAVDRMERHAIAVRLAELGRQLAVAAALTRAWKLGWGPAFVCLDDGNVTPWKPGRGKAAP